MARLFWLPPHTRFVYGSRCCAHLVAFTVRCCGCRLVCVGCAVRGLRTCLPAVHVMIATVLTTGSDSSVVSSVDHPFYQFRSCLRSILLPPLPVLLPVPGGSGYSCSTVIRFYRIRIHAVYARCVHPRTRLPFTPTRGLPLHTRTGYSCGYLDSLPRTAFTFVATHTFLVTLTYRLYGCCHRLDTVRSVVYTRITGYYCCPLWFCRSGSHVTIRLRLRLPFAVTFRLFGSHTRGLPHTTHTRCRLGSAARLRLLRVTCGLHGSVGLLVGCAIHTYTLPPAALPVFAHILHICVPTVRLRVYGSCTFTVHRFVRAFYAVAPRTRALPARLPHVYYAVLQFWFYVTRSFYTALLRHTTLHSCYLLPGCLLVNVTVTYTGSATRFTPLCHDLRSTPFTFCRLLPRFGHFVLRVYTLVGYVLTRSRVSGYAFFALLPGSATTARLHGFLHTTVYRGSFVTGPILTPAFIAHTFAFASCGYGSRLVVTYTTAHGYRYLPFTTAV